MRGLKKLLTASLVASFLFLPVTSLRAECGEGYCQSSCCFLRPEWYIGALAVAAVVALIITNAGDCHANHSH